MSQIIKETPYQHTKPIDSLTIYLPAYLRLKFKNFIALDLPNLSGQMNATLIYSIYYGSLFQQLNNYGISQADKEMIQRKMENEFVINFSKDDAIQLTEGKTQKVKNRNQPKINQKIGQNIDKEHKNKVKLKRNIEITVKSQQKQKMIKFTLRKNFTVLLRSSVFWTPFQIVDSILEITVQSLKLKTKDKPISLTIQINLMDTSYGPSKYSYSQQKKFGQYGIILSGLEAIYSNKKQVVCDPQVFDQKVQKSQDKVGKFEKKLQNEQAKRFKKDYDMVMVDKKYQQSYRAWYQNNKAKYLLLEHEDVSKKTQNQYITPKKNLQIQQQTIQNLEQSKLKMIQDKNYSNQQYEKSPQRVNKKITNEKGSESEQKLQACKYASFKIALYKLPFTSLATIFIPLWLLAVLNLGVFFQDDNLADRIACIASLALAFIAFIPTIRQQIPPSPTIVLVEILVYLVAATSLLALGQSISVHQIQNFVFQQWQNDPWFMISMILNIVVCAIVIFLTFMHYCIWQPCYKTKLDSGKDSKFDRRCWWNRPCEKEFRKTFNTKKIFEISNINQNDNTKVFEVIDNDDSIFLKKDSMINTR